MLSSITLLVFCAFQHVISIAVIDGSSFRIVLNIGRERGTWMPDSWASSGARLSIPLDVTFSESPMTTPSWDKPAEAMLGPIKDTKMCFCRGGSFVGPAGEVPVECTGGAWSSTPTGRCGESILRFYLDFPNGAERNDVTLPPGRLFFNSACWDAVELSAGLREREEVEEQIEKLREDQQAARAREGLDVLEQAKEVRETLKRAEEYDKLKFQLDYLRKSLPDSRGSLDVPRSGLDVPSKIAAAGGLSIKANGAKNLFGALGDVYHIVGRFEIRSPCE